MSAGLTRSIYQPVLVRGAGCGLGMAVARAVNAAGGRALGLCSSAESLRRLESGGLEGVVCPVPEELDLDGGFAGAEAYVDCSHSRVEGLVAGLDPARIDAWASQDIALRARFLRAVVRLMLPRRRGRCLFISSAAAAAPGPGQGYYAAAKAAGETLFASAGLELAPRGITACSLRLGWLDTGRGREFLAGRKERCERIIPTGRLVGLDEAVEGVLYLLSTGASSVNATTITMDGGFTRAKQQPGRGI